MIELFKLHWLFIKRPLVALDEYVQHWSLSLGITLYVFNFFAIYFRSGQTISMMSDVLTAVFGLSGRIYVYGFLIIVTSYSVVFLFFVQPIIARMIAKMPKESFNVELFRKVIFFSPTSSAIYSALVLLPVSIASSFLITDGNVSYQYLILVFVQSILSLWAIIPLFNMFVIQWQGYKRFFSFTSFQIILMVIIIPFMLSSPIMIIFGSRYFSFMQNYMH
jgi:hypothetical protein